MRQVTLLFPSYQAFRLWCKGMDILRDEHTPNALRYADRLLGHYRPASGAQAGILAEITVPRQSIAVQVKGG